jgi:Kef-type K+ transport system membrane component KefB
MAGGASEYHEDVELLQLLVLWILTYVSAFFAEHTRLSPLLFYILFGAVLANGSKIYRESCEEGDACEKFLHLLIPEKQSQFGYVLSELAITVVFFALGLEESVDHFVAGIRKAWGIAVIGAIVPFMCGYGVISLMFDGPPEEALMSGLAVTATAVSLTMIALKSEGLATSKPAMGVITSAVLDDIACLAFVAIMVPLLTGEAAPTPESVGFTVGKAIGFFVLIGVLHYCVLARVLPPLISMHHAEETTVFSLAWGLGWGCIAWQFNFHPAIGAYMAGLVLEEHYYDVIPGTTLVKRETQALAESEAAAAANAKSEDNGDKGDKVVAFAEGTKKARDTGAFSDETEMNVAVGMGISLEDLHGEHLNAYHHTQEVIEDAAFKWLGPLFFFNLGKKLIIVPEEIYLVLTEIWVLYFVLATGQILSAAFAARFVPGGFTWGDSLMIGFGMLGRAELFFVVLDIGEKNKIIGKSVFYTLVFAAMLMNISVPVTISLFKPYYVGEKESCFHHHTHKGDYHDLEDHPEEERRDGLGLLVAALHDKVAKKSYSKGHRLRRPEKVVPPPPGKTRGAPLRKSGKAKVITYAPDEDTVPELMQTQSAPDLSRTDSEDTVGPQLEGGESTRAAWA